MNALQKDLQELVARHVALTPHKLPRLIEALADDALIFGRPTRPRFAGDRFINVGADGKPTTGDHVAIYDQEADLTWAANPISSDTNLKVLAAAESFTLLGSTGWKAPTVKQLIAGPVDYTRYPVLDPKHFGKWPKEYVWTSTPDPESPASCSYVVDLHSGNVYRNHHGYRYHALAVLAGQPLGFQF